MADVGVGAQEPVANDKFSNYDAYAPHVDGATVVSTAIEQLWGPVHARNGHGGHLLARVSKATGETEIGELDGAVGGNEGVAALDVAVQDVVLVAEPDALAQHVGPGLDVGGAVGNGLVVPQLLEVAAREVLEHERQVLLLGGEDGVQLDDVGVGELGEELDLADGVEGDAVGEVGVELHGLDGHDGGRVVAVVGGGDDGVGALSEFGAAHELAAHRVVHLLGEVLAAVGGGRGRDGGAGMAGMAGAAAEERQRARLGGIGRDAGAGRVGARAQDGGRRYHGAASRRAEGSAVAVDMVVRARAGAVAAIFCGQLSPLPHPRLPHLALPRLPRPATPSHSLHASHHGRRRPQPGRPQPHVSRPRRAAAAPH